MQVNNVNSSNNFGTKCLIGENSARLGLKNFNENITKGIHNAFKKLSKNDAGDTFVLSIGSTSKTCPNTSINMSYFDDANNYKSSVNFDLTTLKNYTKDSISQLVTGTYRMLTNTEHKMRDIVSLPAGDNTKVSKQTLSAIEKLTKEFGSDDMSLL